jgi:SAM-dependent methyltransferase
MMHWQVHAAQGRGIHMMHTARPFSYYRKVFYQGQPESQVLRNLTGKRVIDVGCGYTPYAQDSMFQACHKADIEFYGIDPVIEADKKFGFKERALARALGSTGRFDVDPPGISKALSTTAQDLPFEDSSVDEIICSYLLFVWIEDEAVLAELFSEFSRVLKSGGGIKLDTLYAWRYVKLLNADLRKVLAQFEIKQSFVHGGLDFRVTPSMLTEFRKR